jgi:hypothetical protein
MSDWYRLPVAWRQEVQWHQVDVNGREEEGMVAVKVFALQ